MQNASLTSVTPQCKKKDIKDIQQGILQLVTNFSEEQNNWDQYVKETTKSKNV